jgi:hypothetical protein
MKARNPTLMPERFRDLVSDADYEVLEVALAALLRERSCAMRIAAKVPTETGREAPQVKEFGLPDILRRSRAISSRELCPRRCKSV